MTLFNCIGKVLLLMASTFNDKVLPSVTSWLLATASRYNPVQAVIIFLISSDFRFFQRWSSNLVIKEYAFTKSGILALGFLKSKFRSTFSSNSPMAFPPLTRFQLVSMPSKRLAFSCGMSPLSSSKYSCSSPRVPVLPKPCDWCRLLLSAAIS